MPRQRQVHEERIAAGLAPAPEAAPLWRDFVETLHNYLAYGESLGGGGGSPWAVYMPATNAPGWPTGRSRSASRP